METTNSSPLCFGVRLHQAAGMLDRLRGQGTRGASRCRAEASDATTGAGAAAGDGRATGGVWEGWGAQVMHTMEAIESPFIDVFSH